MKSLHTIVVVTLLIVLVSSCTGRRYNMLHTAADEETQVSLLNSGVPTLRVGQELCVTVSALSEESAQYFRTSREREGATGIECLIYQVNENGAVDMPLIGEVTVAGLTLQQAEEGITASLEKLLKEPTVRVEHTDYHVSVLGEVALPGKVYNAKGRITIFEALSETGGITQFGRRDNVLIIREKGKDLQHIRVDMTKEDIWNTDYYFLHPNDVIMVSSNSGRITNSKNITAFGSILVGLGTVAAILVTR